ncbi:MAG: hypothetical protein LBR23_04165 [Spirochaetaceae bacterium]|jgi:DNA-binding transcriptional regulator LsrR (DeoR family)|nr:hypothetical protein [Spirochaetaceae bacterium]
MDFEEELCAKAAWYYYLENRTQQNIAQLLGVSRMRVIRLLEKALRSGIVQFKIREDSARRMKAEKLLMENYGLKGAMVIPAPPNAGIAEINDIIADGAAMYIASRMTPDSFINIGYGDTAGKTLNSLAKIAEHPISCVSLTGGVGLYLPNARSSTFNARLFLIPAPFIVSSPEMASAVREEGPVQEVLRMTALSSFTIVGIGGMNDGATILNMGVITKSDFLYLKMKGAIGDILCHFIDRNGAVIDTPFEDRLISVRLDALKSLPNVIACAAGKEKREAIRGVLKLGCIDTLITSEDTADWLNTNTKEES